MINKKNIEKYWDDYPNGAIFTYQSKYGGGVITGEVDHGSYQTQITSGNKLIKHSGRLTGIVSTNGANYKLSEITLESEPEMKRRIREEKLNQIL